MAYETHPKMLALLKKHEEDISKLETELLIEEQFPEAFRSVIRHTHFVKKGEVWVTLQRHEKYGYRPDSPKPFTLLEAVKMLAHFSTVPLEVTSGSCTSTHPVGLRPNSAKDDSLKWPQYPSFPWYLRVGTHNDVEFVFYAVVGGSLLQVTIELGTALSHKMRRVEWKEYAGGECRKVIKTSAVPTLGAVTITWASGGHEYPGDVSFFPHNVEMLLNSLEPEK